MTPMEILHDQIANALSDMESLFKRPDDYRITLLARNVRNPLAHVIVSSEEAEDRFARVRQGLEELERTGREVGYPPPTDCGSAPKEK